jgi:hypothetical protein
MIHAYPGAAPFRASVELEIATRTPAIRKAVAKRTPRPC